MLEVTLAPELVAKFKELLAEEDSEDAVFRIRETKVGGGWKSHMELRVSLDERDDPDEEVEIEVEGIPFLTTNEIIDSYGEKFSILVSDKGTPEVKAG